MIEFTLNNKKLAIDDVDEDMPLLWYLRDELKLKGTKYGCGIGQCGACTVHLNGNAVRSCSIPVSALNGSKITTIEGLSEDKDSLHPVQQAWLELDVPQCGYCQTGQIMAAVSMLETIPNPSDDDINTHMTNICRCGIYPRIRKAIKHAAKNSVSFFDPTKQSHGQEHQV